MTQSIPKLVVQTGPSRVLPVLGRCSAYTIRGLNPDFDYLFFDDNDIDDFIDSNFPSYRKVANSFRYKIQRIDFFRYLVIYQLGGFYFDLDVILARSLDTLLNQQCVFTFEELSALEFLRNEHNMDWAVGNYAFGAVAGHPLLAAVIDNCIRAQTEPQWVEPMLRPIPRPFRSDFFVLCTTGPGLVSRTIAERPDLANRMTIFFPDDVCDRRQWNHFGDFGVHLAAGDWRQASGGFGSGLKRFLEARWFEWMRRRQLKESRRRGPRRERGSLLA